ncbi:MAG: ribosome silencing factor [Planctomycetaceae bacterium]
MSSDDFLSIPRLTANDSSVAPETDPSEANLPSAEDGFTGMADPPRSQATSSQEEQTPEADPTYDTETVNAPRSPDLYQRSLQNALIAARCADEMRARDVVVLDMTKIASIVDFFVIATGTSRRQMHAIADEVNRKLKGEGKNQRLSVEGYRTEANWILMDFGDIVLHVFTEEGRRLYDLENLKADATRINWQTT